MFQRGNHKSVQEDVDEVQKLLEKYVLHGSSLPVSPETVPNIEQALVQPAGVVEPRSRKDASPRTYHFPSRSQAHP
jgi:hypothetical protein